MSFTVAPGLPVCFGWVEIVDDEVAAAVDDDEFVVEWERVVDEVILVVLIIGA